MQYTSTERQARFDKLDRQYDRLLEMQDRWEDHNTEDLITEIQIQIELLDLEESKAQIDKCREERTITRDAYWVTIQAINFQKQSLINKLTAMVKERQAVRSLKIG